MPPRPAMNAAMANAAIFVPTTLIPAAAAERSLARTANMALPSALRRSNATASATPISTTRTVRQNAGRGILGARAGTQCESEQLRLRDALAGRSDEVSVLEPDCLDRDGERQRHDRERQTADPQCRDTDDDADHRRTERSSDRREREGHTPVGGERPEQEGGDAGERELRERDLPASTRSLRRSTVR